MAAMDQMRASKKTYEHAARMKAYIEDKVKQRMDDQKDREIRRVELERK